VRIPDDAVTPEEKLAQYLLVPRPWDDKARFLAQAGFVRQDPNRLRQATRALVSSCPASEDGSNEYGVFLRAEGELIGPNGRSLPVVTIWLRWHADGSVHFVTLKPQREGRR
jgi:hypothetical protein